MAISLAVIDTTNGETDIMKVADTRGAASVRSTTMMIGATTTTGTD